VWFGFMRGMPAAMIAAMAACVLVGVVRLWRTASGGILLAPLLALPAITVPVQRVLAPTRVWIYFLPLLFTYAATGLMAVVEWIGARLRLAGPPMASATAATLAFAIGLHGATGLPARYTEWNDDYEIYAHTDLDAVAGYLKTSLASGDALVVGGLLDFPLEYHLRILGVPIASLRRPPPRPARVIVLANDSVNQPVQRVLTINGYDPARTTVRLIRRFTYSSLYELEP